MIFVNAGDSLNLVVNNPLDRVYDKLHRIVLRRV